MPPKERNIMWMPWNEPGLEHLRLVQQTGVVADGIVVGTEEQSPFRLHYTIQCDPGWLVREVELRLLGPQTKDLTLHADGAGHWHDATGASLSSLDGCLDVDIAVTPFTNTLPIRRLALPVGNSEIIDVVYITVPDLQFKPVRQRYTCVEQNANSRLFRYESLDSSFTALLPVDEDGVVLDYPELFRRVWSN